MNKLFLILGILFVLAALVLGIFVGFKLLHTGTATTPGNITFPTGGGGNSHPVVTTITAADGSQVEVSDFEHNGETVSDTVNPGSYVLAGSLGYCLPDGSCPKGADTKDFSVSYSESSHSFNVVLLTEPIGAARAQAEQFLLNRLGVTKDQLCSLSYFVGTPYWVNQTFDNGNLGFSFCPNAVKLPS